MYGETAFLIRLESRELLVVHVLPLGLKGKRRTFVLYFGTHFLRGGGGPLSFSRNSSLSFGSHEMFVWNTSVVNGRTSKRGLTDGMGSGKQNSTKVLNTVKQVGSRIQAPGLRKKPRSKKNTPEGTDMFLMNYFRRMKRGDFDRDSHLSDPSRSLRFSRLLFKT